MAAVDVEDNTRVRDGEDTGAVAAVVLAVEVSSVDEAEAVAVTSGAAEVVSAVLPVVSRLRRDISNMSLLCHFGFNEAYEASNLWTAVHLVPTLSI